MKASLCSTCPFSPNTSPSAAADESGPGQAQRDAQGGAGVRPPLTEASPSTSGQRGALCPEHRAARPSTQMSSAFISVVAPHHEEQDVKLTLHHVHGIRGCAVSSVTHSPHRVATQTVDGPHEGSVEAHHPWVTWEAQGRTSRLRPPHQSATWRHGS